MIVSLGPELLARLTRLDNASPTAETEQLDGDLVTAVRRTERMRKLFYAAVLAVALYGSAPRPRHRLRPAVVDRHRRCVRPRTRRRDIPGQRRRATPARRARQHVPALRCRP